MKNQNVAVIGGAGFLGSHLVDYLIEQGNEVLVLDNLIAGRKEFINPQAEFLWCDITHSEFELEKIFTKYKIDYVFNYAAIPYVPVSYKRPLHIFDINARGALMVMNAADHCGVKGILQVSSAEIYGEVEDRADNMIDEESPARPHSTYGASKLAIDTIVQTRWREAACPAISLRQFNCVGERDILHPYVIPEIYKQLCKGEIVYLGNDTYRDFMYAGDAVRMAVELLEKGKHGEVYNLGFTEGIKIYNLANLMGILMAQEVFVEVDDKRKRKWEVWHLQSDNTKIYGAIEGRPTTSLEDAIRKTITYYKESKDKWAF